MNTIECRLCGSPMTATDEPERWICGSCGTTRREMEAGLTLSAAASMNPASQVVRYPVALLAVARCVIEQGDFGLAVVAAHMACEVAVERTLNAAFAKRGIPEVGEAVMSLLNGFNLGNDQLRQTYSALTGDVIASEPFWSTFKKSATRRNRVVHRAAPVTEAEALESLMVATRLVEHLERIEQQASTGSVLPGPNKS